MFSLDPYWLMWIALGLAVVALMVSVSSAMVRDDDSVGAVGNWQDRTTPVAEDASASTTGLTRLG